MAENITKYKDLKKIRKIEEKLAKAKESQKYDAVWYERNIEKIERDLANEKRKSRVYKL